MDLRSTAPEPCARILPLKPPDFIAQGGAAGDIGRRRIAINAVAGKYSPQQDISFRAVCCVPRRTMASNRRGWRQTRCGTGILYCCRHRYWGHGGQQDCARNVPWPYRHRWRSPKPGGMLPEIAGSRIQTWVQLARAPRRGFWTSNCGAGGEGGIRTHGGLPPTAVFKTAALNHSATSPREQRFAQGRRFVQVARRWDFTFAARCGTVCRCADGV